MPTMFIGLDAVQSGRTSIIGMTASSNSQGTKYFSRMVTQQLPSNMVNKASKVEQEDWICKDRTSQFT